MKRIILLLSFIALFFICCFDSSDMAKAGESTASSSSSSYSSLADSGYDMTLVFQGPSVAPATVYVCWVEDESGNCLQNIYVCNREVGIGGGLLGTALPYWKREKYTVCSGIDGVTGASVQGNTGLNITRDLKIGTVKRFRVCFEIDRSLNSNDYFGDRPAFVYRSDVIDLDSLSLSAYNLQLYAWMANNTASGSYSQQPKTGVTIPGFGQFMLMTDKVWIEPVTDMVSTLNVTVFK